MSFLLFIVFMYLLYRFGKWMIKISKKLENFSRSVEDYNKDLLVQSIAYDSKEKKEKRYRSLKEEHQELQLQQKTRRLIEEELDIKM